MFRTCVLTACLSISGSCVSHGIADANGPTTLTAMVYIEGDYDAVWARFTRAESFADWYTVPCRSFSTEPGAELVWADGERVVYRGRMLEAEKGAGIAWEFKFIGFDFDEPMTPVRFEILERGETVLVAVIHDVSGAPQTSAIISPVGWSKPLSRLKTLLETGTAMTWPEEAGASAR